MGPSLFLSPSPPTVQSRGAKGRPEAVLQGTLTTNVLLCKLENGAPSRQSWPVSGRVLGERRKTLDHTRGLGKAEE
jgi:hypothetical protein